MCVCVSALTSDCAFRRVRMQQVRLVTMCGCADGHVVCAFWHVGHAVYTGLRSACVCLYSNTTLAQLHIPS